MGKQEVLALILIIVVVTLMFLGAGRYCERCGEKALSTHQYTEIMTHPCPNSSNKKHKLGWYLRRPKGGHTHNSPRRYIQ